MRLFAKKIFSRAAVAALALSAAVFASCDFGFDENSFQNRAGAYFKEMTSTASINAYSIEPDDAPTDRNGNTCFDYDNDDGYVVTFTLRNPQHYSFTSGTNMYLELAGNTDTENPFPEADTVTITQDADDTTKILVKYPAAFLKANPKGADISPVVTLMHPVSFASFGRSSIVKISSNAPPPVAAGAVTMQTEETPSKWVLCFNLPTIGMTKVYHSDINNVKINDASFDVTVDDGKISFASGASISTTIPSNVVANQITGVSFQVNGQPCYYVTGDVADENEKIYTITITDEAGLSSKLEVSSKGKKVDAPNAYAPDDTEHKNPFVEGGETQNCTNQKDDGTGEIRLYAEAKTAKTKTREQEAYTPTGDERIIYEVYTDKECTELLASGKIKGLEGVVSVPGGDSYIKAYVRKPYYADSELAVWKSRVVRTTIYVASEAEGGSDSNDGTKSRPYATIQKAVGAFKEAVANGDYGTDAVTLEVLVMSDLSAPSSYDWGNDKPFVEIDMGSTFAGTLKIRGNESVRTVNTGTPAGGIHRLFSAGALQNVAIEKIKFAGAASLDAAGFGGNSLEMTDCEISGISGGLVVTSGNVKLTNVKICNNSVFGIKLNAGSVECNDCSIDNNGASAGASTGNGGIYVAADANLVVKGGTINGNTAGANGGAINALGAISVDGTTMAGNTAAGDGGAIYAAATANLANVTITGSSSGGNGGAIYAAKAVNLDGVTITGNTATSNGGALSLQEGATLDGVTITGNSASLRGGAIDFVDGTLSVSGKCEIYGNNLTGDGAKKHDIYLPESKLVYCAGSLAGSTIGVYRVFAAGTEPAIGAPVAFTTNYAATNAAIKPGAVFKAQNDYGVTANTAGEAAFAVGGGGADYGALDYSFAFELADSAGDAASVIYPGQATDFVLKIKPSRQKDTDPAPQELYYNNADKQLYVDSALTVPAVDGGQTVSLEATLWSSGKSVGTLALVDASSGSFNMNIPAQSYEGAFAIRLTVQYLGIESSSTFNLNCSRGADNAAFYIKNLTAAGTYDVVVTGPVGSGDTDGLAKVANAIRAKTSAGDTGVRINLDASGTSAVGSLVAYNNGQYFKDCKALASVTLPSWMEFIIHDLFNGCENLAAVAIPDTVEYIAANAFTGCQSLAQVTLPAAISGSGSLRGIGQEAFDGCTALATINYAGTTVDWKAINRGANWHRGVAATVANCSDGSCDLDALPGSFNIPSAGGTTFQMGCSEETNSTPHSVTLTRSFWICDHEVTQAEYLAVMGTNPSEFDGTSGKEPASGEAQELRPVDQVSWYDAITYCNKRSIAEGLQPCYTVSGVDFNGPVTVPTDVDTTWNAAIWDLTKNGYRLPTEAEWEFAARGIGFAGAQTDTSGKVWAGAAAESDLGKYVWCLSNSDGKTHAVKTNKQAGVDSKNAAGLYDMCGNVAEWCWDWFNFNYYADGQIDPTGASYPGTLNPSALIRSRRGAGYSAEAVNSTVTYRGYGPPSQRASHIGLRVVRTLP